jgi:hypothetical protein
LLHSLVFLYNFDFNLYVSLYLSYTLKDSLSSIFLALSASLKVESVSLRQLLDGEIQQIIKLLPEPVRDVSRSLVNLESLKGICAAFYASLDMQFVS